MNQSKSSGKRLSLSKTSISRRAFVGGAAAAAGAAVLGFPAILRGRNLNSELNVIVIGCGGQGKSNLRRVADENVVALCDVNDNNLTEAASEHPDAKKFHDFRELYATLKEGDYDAAVVTVPEHTHAFATLPALQRKKHVYCEKPLTRDVYESRLITQAAIQAGVATQMGTQNHANDNFRRVVELIQGNAIGPVHEVHIWISRAWGWQSKEEAEQMDLQVGEGEKKKRIWTVERPSSEDPVPAFLNWDLWIGPAPMRPFNNIYFPGPKWYRWWDFGNGSMSDMGSHWNDMAFWALKLDAPKAIEAAGPPPHPEIAPASMSATYEFGARGEMPPVKLTWYQGTMKPKMLTEKQIPQWSDGALFIGSKGMLLSDYNKHVLLPEEQFKDFKRPPETIEKSIGHHNEWLRACKTGTPTLCPFSYSGPLTESNHLGNVAYRAGKRIEWDSANMKIPNAPDAERFLRREYRKGWTLG